ncbi:RNA-directed DNA polymerase, eukaryota [Tanacetum coccineum]
MEVFVGISFTELKMAIEKSLGSNGPSFFSSSDSGGPEAQQLEQLTNLLDSVSLSNMEDMCFGILKWRREVFQVKDVRSVLDETFLPKENIPTRWVKSIPIKVNVFVWKLVQDRIPTRLNLMSRNIFVPSVECPVL